jgi:hypothetical protein
MLVPFTGEGWYLYYPRSSTDTGNLYRFTSSWHVKRPDCDLRSVVSAEEIGISTLKHLPYFCTPLLFPPFTDSRLEVFDIGTGQYK